MQVKNWIIKQDIDHGKIIEQISKWSSICTGSYHQKGLVTLEDILFQELNQFPGQVSRVALDPIPVWGDQGVQSRLTSSLLKLEVRPHCSKQILLMIHYDTVFGEGSPFQTVLQRGDTLYGPGVCDAKSGIVILLESLKILEKSPWAEDLGYCVVLNPDEEIGSPASNSFLQKLKKSYQFALLFEPCLENGNLAGNRKGSGNFAYEFHGKSAHAGRDFYSGKNAILMLNEVITKVNALNHEFKNLTANIAVVKGGNAFNVVPDYATLRFNVRVQDLETMNKVNRVLEEINSELKNKGYDFEFHGGFQAPPKHIHTDLSRYVKATHNEYGISIDYEDSGGVCDGNRLAYFGIPNVDTMGGWGGKIHSSEEYLRTDSLVPKIRINSDILIRFAKNEWQGV
jgi:glutamate carboxypeptidase